MQIFSVKFYTKYKKFFETKKSTPSFGLLFYQVVDIFRLILYAFK